MKPDDYKHTVSGLCDGEYYLDKLKAGIHHGEKGYKPMYWDERNKKYRHIKFPDIPQELAGKYYLLGYIAGREYFYLAIGFHPRYGESGWDNDSMAASKIKKLILKKD